MRILSISFSNLNSLYGTWEIDFRHTEYYEQGIFAIIGSTGSGKTTILDAICLALYGKTPRLEKVSTTENDILSVGADACFASVRFSTSKGEYLVHWEQKKSKRKGDAELQNTKQSLYLVDGSSDGVLLSNKKKEISDHLNEITGLSGIDQFTRSVLLAQGRFSEFLEATEDTRAKMLEKITGVEIYTDLSIAAHENAKKWNEKIREIEREKNISHLSEEEIAQQTAEQETLGQQLNEQNQRKKEVEGKQAVLETVQKLKKSFTDLDGEKEKILEEKKKFAPEEEILQLAQRARELETQHASIKECRTQVTRQSKEIEAYLKQKSDITIDRDKVKLEVEETAKNHQKMATEKEDLEMILTKVRTLDTFIAGLKKDISGVEKEKRENETDIQRCKEKQKTAAEKQKLVEHEIQEQKRWISAHEVDKTLLSSLSGIQSEIEQQKKLMREHALYSKTQKELIEREKTAKGREIKAKAEVEKLQKSVETCTQLRDACKAAYDGVMGGRDLETMQIDLEAAQSHRKDIEACIERITAYRTCVSEWMEYCAEYLIENQKLNEMNSQLEEEKERGKIAKQKYDEIVRLHSLSAERGELSPGKPCPLCGSTEHPYASRFIVDEEVTQAKKNVSDAEEKEKKLQELEQKQRTKRDQTFARSEMRRQEHQNLYKAAISLYARLQLQNHHELLRPQDSAPNAEQVRSITTCIDALQELSIASIKEISQKKEEFAICTKQSHDEKKAQTDLEKVQMKFQEESARFQKNTQETITCTHEVQKYADQLMRVAKDLSENGMKLTCDIGNYGYITLPMKEDELDTLLNELSMRSQAYQDKERNHGQKNDELISLLNEQQIIGTNFEHMQESLKQVDEKLSDLKKEYFDHISSRKGLFGEKDPDMEQSTVNEKMKCAENAKNTAHTTLTNISAEIQSLERRISEAEIALLQKRNVLEKKEKDFSAACIAHGFRTEEAFLNAVCPLDTIHMLLKKEKELLERVQQLSGQQNHLEKEWNKIDHMQISETKEELEYAYTRCNEQIKVFTEEVGRIKERLHADEKARERVQQLQAAYEKLRLEAEPWLELDFLIGSNDGKAYRDFAQSLTFDVLIAYANTHLQRLTDRYQLNCGESLTFQVRDLYQAGEIRSVKNLSGGEKFIVSLALALGLSGMAGEKICIDSLFLDEGFGTLDEQALEIALDALSNLPHEGKTIGIISHVRALKERIPTQISINKVGDGRSVLTGPGCRCHGS